METQQVACLVDKLNVTEDEPYFPHPVTGQPVFVLFDLPHLIKCLRNNFMSYDILVRPTTEYL